MLDRLRIPIVQAPMAGGPSTPELAAAVGQAGAVGFLAAGYRSAATLDEDVARLRALSAAPFGVNVFAVAPTEAAPGALEAYGRRVEAVTGAAPGAPRSDDDAFAEKVELLLARRVPLVSFTFGCPGRELIGRLREAGVAVWVTVTEPAEAVAAAEAGADALVLQGVEAGGHRAVFDDARPSDLGVLALLQLVRAAVDLPLVASGGVATGRAVAAVLAGGAAAAQVGTALLCASEAATSAPHREAVAAPGRTALTRAFSGRLARGIANRFMAELDAEAPRAYPAVHHMTAPIRARAREAGDAGLVNLWAGQAHELARAAPAAEIVGGLWSEAQGALAEASARWAGA